MNAHVGDDAVVGEVVQVGLLTVFELQQIVLVVAGVDELRRRDVLEAELAPQRAGDGREGEHRPVLDAGHAFFGRLALGMEGAEAVRRDPDLVAFARAGVRDVVRHD